MPVSDKRERLVESAKTLFHEQGVLATTLADVAAGADVPLGNVYYYFKTKDELIRAVVESRSDEVRQLFDRLEQKRTPQARLKALAQEWSRASEIVARHGCPIGSLCAELDKTPGHVRDGTEPPLALLVDWSTEQLQQLGRRDARDLAYSIIARIQGASLLAHDFGDPQILVREARQIERWIDTLA